MGGILSRCFENKPKPDDYRVITGIVPNKVDEINQSVSIDQIERFYYLPHENQINKAIEHLEEATVISDKDALLLNELISELSAHRKKLTTTVISRQTITGQSGANSNPSSQKESENRNVMMESSPKSVRSHTLAINFKNPFPKDAKAPNLMVEVRCAKFLHEEVLQKYDLRDPYVVVKICVRQDKKQDVVAIEDYKPIKTYTTEKSREKVNPRWSAFYDHDFNISQKDKMNKLPLYSVGVSLFYIRGANNEVWQAGDEQHFSLSSLVDQKMQIKIIDFKDQMTKGTLAKVKIVFQLLHNVEEVRERLKRDVEIGIERLMRVRDRHMLPNTMKFTGSLLNSMAGGGIDNQQSALSAYSLVEGLKESEYYIE